MFLLRELEIRLCTDDKVRLDKIVDGCLDLCERELLTKLRVCDLTLHQTSIDEDIFQDLHMQWRILLADLYQVSGNAESKQAFFVVKVVVGNLIEFRLPSSCQVVLNKVR